MSGRPKGLISRFQYSTTRKTSQQERFDSKGFPKGVLIAMRKTRLVVVGIGMVVLCLLAAAYGQNSITTVAGGGPNNLPATKSSAGAPWGVVQDANGNTYFSDNLTNRVFKVDGSGTLTVLAGNIVSGYTLDGIANAAASASLSSPQGVAVDGAGLIYIAQTTNNVIRVVNPTANPVTIAGLTIPANGINTIAGDGTACADPTQPCGDGGVATSAQLNAPAGVFVDGSGNIFIADTTDNKIRRVDISTGNISTVAGTGVPCADPTTACGDTALATSAQLNFPKGVFVDGSGNIFIADTSDVRVREVTAADGKINAYAGNGHVCADPTTACGDGGAATAAQLKAPIGIFLDGANLYIADSGDFRIRMVSGGNISTVAGDGTQGFAGDGALAVNAELDTPTGVFVDGSHNLFITDLNNDSVREVTAADQFINTFAANLSSLQNGIPAIAFSGDADSNAPAVAGVPTNAELREPSGVAADASGNYYIADAGNNRVRLVNNQSTQIIKASVTIPAHSIKTVAGSGGFCLVPPCGDGGTANAAQISAPSDVALDKAEQNLFILAYQDSAVKKVVLSTGAIQTVAGDLTQAPGYSGDNGPATSAQMNQPLGMALDSAGNIYIADTSNNVVRVVNSQASDISIAGVTIHAGQINTVVGDGTGTACNPTTDACGDGGLANAAGVHLNGPSGVALDNAGNIYIADTQDNRIRVVNTQASTITIGGVSIPSHQIKTLAGTGAPCLSSSCGDAGPATAALLLQPFDMFVDYAGTVFISDTGDCLVRAVNTGAGSITVDTKTIAPGDIDTVVGGTNGTGGCGFFGDGGPALNAALAQPLGLASDAAGDLLTTDFITWRVRSVGGMLASAPTATPSPANLAFATQNINTTSAVKTVTLTNSGNLTTLTNLSAAITGADNTDFAIAASSTCGSSLAAGASCTYDINFTPSAVRGFNAALTITDSAPNSPQSVALSGTGVAAPDFTIGATAANPATVSAGSSATSTITVAAQNGFNSAVTLTCSVAPASTNGPACGLNPVSLPTGAGTSTLTITTTAASASVIQPAVGRRSAPFYAFWLFLPAILFSTAGMTTPKRKKLVSCILLMLALTGLLFMAACGGGSGNGGGGGGGGGTAAGTYTVTVTATPAAGTAHTTTVTLKVQ